MTRRAPGDPYIGGSTWTRLPAAGIPANGQPGQLWFADDRHGLLLVTYPSGGMSVLATDGGGATWREAAQFGPPYACAWILGAALVSHGHRPVLSPEILPNVPSCGGVLADPAR